MNAKNLNRLINKLEYLDWCGHWYGHLTPTEVCWLLDNGAREDRSQEEYYRQLKKEGDNWYGCSFYFNANKSLLQIINKDDKQKMAGIKKERVDYE